MKKRLISACAGVFAVGALGAVANAALTIDLVQDGTNATKVVLSAADLNKPITLNVVASVTGAAGNAELETLSTVRGDFVADGSTKGSFGAAGYYDKIKKVQWVGTKYPAYNFIANGATTGTAADLNGDGNADVQNVLFRSSQALYFDGESGIGTELPDGGVQFVIGKITFTPSALGGDTWINFKPLAKDTGGVAAAAGLWTEDSFDVIKNGETGSMISHGFQIIVPEPASLSVLGLGGALLLGRRNRK
ncbi:MAG: PEP-CTERM sorting domain-containing protein [Bacillota bacterium]